MKFMHQHFRNLLLLPALIAGYIFLYLQPTPVFGEPHSTWCLFHLVTGLPCPACGTGRGLMCLLHGNFYDALMFNPLSFVVAALSLLLAIMVLKDFFRKTNSLKLLAHIRIQYSYQILIVLFLVANEIWNIQKGM